MQTVLILQPANKLKLKMKHNATYYVTCWEAICARLTIASVLTLSLVLLSWSVFFVASGEAAAGFALSVGLSGAGGTGGVLGGIKGTAGLGGNGGTAGLLLPAAIGLLGLLGGNAGTDGVGELLAGRSGSAGGNFFSS